jgi:hypothetical protein
MKYNQNLKKANITRAYFPTTARKNNTVFDNENLREAHI